VSESWPTPAEAPAFVSRIQDAQAALDKSIAGLTDELVWAPSLLPGWTRGHVLTHLARHADATFRMIEGARRDEIVPQYEGGAVGRAAQIEAGADRSADELVADVHESGQRCHGLLGSVAPEVWSRTIAGDVPATKALVSRWREIEIHRVDLGLDYTGDDWPAEFVEFLLPRELPRLADRAAGVQPPDGLTGRALLAWLIGRGTPELPQLPNWA
jgi:maleylpyruvate isomerase